MRTLALALAFLASLAPFTARAGAFAQQRVPGSRIAAIAARALAGSFRETADARLVPAGAVPDQLVDAGKLTLHAGTPLGTQFYYNVPVALDVDGQTQRTIYVGYRVERFVQTAVAAHDLAAGDVLASGDLRMARVPATGNAANGIDVLVGRRLLDPVMHGQPVHIFETAVNDVVHAGDTVVLIVRDGAVQVTAPVVARSSGGIGDDVYVYNPQTRKALSGTVTAPGTVVLDISGGEQ